MASALSLGSLQLAHVLPCCDPAKGVLQGGQRGLTDLELPSPNLEQGEKKYLFFTKPAAAGVLLEQQKLNYPEGMEAL